MTLQNYEELRIIPNIWDILLKNVISGQSESETDTCRDGVIADILDILGEKLGSFAGDELIILLKLVANR